MSSLTRSILSTNFFIVDLEELYQSVILDHARAPRNFGEDPDATLHVHADNPTCGDELTLHLKLDADRNVESVKFTGQGCAISQASASLMTQKIKGKPEKDALEMVQTFCDMLTAEEDKTLPDEYGDLQVFHGVRQFPQRVKCATLGWNALRQGLVEGDDTYVVED